MASEHEDQHQYHRAINQAMQRKLDAGECLDVETVGTSVSHLGPAYAGVYQLREYVDGVDYCVRSTEQWVWSIGRRHADGAIFAALDARFYDNPAFECLWLR